MAVITLSVLLQCATVIKPALGFDIIIKNDKGETIILLCQLRLLKFYIHSNSKAN